METNLKLFFYSEGKKPSEVAAALKELGFKTAIGKYDFAYYWAGKKPTEKDILALGGGQGHGKASWKQSVL